MKYIITERQQKLFEETPKFEDYVAQQIFKEFPDVLNTIRISLLEPNA